MLSMATNSEANQPMSPAVVSRGRSETLPHFPLKLKFVIVGAGIAGLACACALRMSGHHVEVLERSKNLDQKAAGVRSPPNMTKILLKWGLGPALAKIARKCAGSPLFDLETGEQLGTLSWQEAVLKETGADFLLIHHNDLLRMLYDLAINLGATVALGTYVSRVDPQVPSVTLNSGESIHADVVIGADGSQSVTREMITGFQPISFAAQRTLYSLNVPAEVLLKDSQSRILYEGNYFPIWMGNNRFAFGHAAQSGSFILHYNAPGTDPSIEENWQGQCFTKTLNVSRDEPRIRRLFSGTSTMIRSASVVHESSDDWVHPGGKAAVVGEAAHPFILASTHSSAMCIEDAAVLGCLFSHLRARNQIPSFLHAFHKLRQGRCKDVLNNEKGNTTFLSMPPGPERQARNDGLRGSLAVDNTEWDDEKLRLQWEEISGLFAYDAYDVAEDWWLKWGRLREIAEGIS